MRIENFTDLIAWQKARELTKHIYSITNRQRFGSDFALRDQIKWASVSIMSNIAEGFDRASRREFHRFLVIAKGSCAEVRSQLYVALDAEYIEQETFKGLLEMTKEVGRIVGGLRKSVEVK
jgi:four helix bundle protein